MLSLPIWMVYARVHSRFIRPALTKIEFICLSAALSRECLMHPLSVNLTNKRNIPIKCRPNIPLVVFPCYAFSGFFCTFASPMKQLHETTTKNTVFYPIVPVAFTGANYEILFYGTGFVEQFDQSGISR
jgi:hypothetical protein